MRKIVIFLFIIMVVNLIISNKSNVLIPDKAIRIRIIANSNDLKDQENKAIIKNEVNALLYTKLKDIDSYSEAGKIIGSSISDIKSIVSKYTNDYDINYGDNYFPDKTYKGVNYKAGNYESLVIKLGNGKGINFWCVLFPPLCMIDENKLNNVSYKFFVSELLKSIK